MISAIGTSIHTHRLYQKNLLTNTWLQSHLATQKECQNRSSPLLCIWVQHARSGTALPCTAQVWMTVKWGTVLPIPSFLLSLSSILLFPVGTDGQAEMAMLCSRLRRNAAWCVLPRHLSLWVDVFLSSINPFAVARYSLSQGWNLGSSAEEALKNTHQHPDTLTDLRRRWWHLP